METTHTDAPLDDKVLIALEGNPHLCGRTLRFERTGTSRPERVYYRVAADEPSRFHRLSIIIFND